MKIMKKIFFYILIFLTLISCSQVKNIEKNVEKSDSASDYKFWDKELINLTMNGSINSTINGESLSGQFKLMIASTDSISMIIYGPLGVTVGKLFSTQKYFLYFNVLNNEAIEGTPSEDNLNKALQLPLSFSEIVRLFRSETPGDPNDFIKDNTFESNSETLFKNLSKHEKVEFALFSENKNLNQYQQKMKNGKLILNTYYQDYRNFNDFNLAQIIIFKFPEMNADINIRIEKYSINEKFEKPFSFSLPKSINRLNLD